MTLVLVSATITVVMMGIIILVVCNVYSKLSNRVDRLASSTSSLSNVVSEGFSSIRTVTDVVENLKNDISLLTMRASRYCDSISNTIYEIQKVNDSVSASMSTITASAESIKSVIDEKTYTLLCDLKAAVDSSDVTKLAGVVHAATMLMSAYEKANGLVPFKSVKYNGLKVGMDIGIESSDISEHFITPSPVPYVITNNSSDATPYAN